MEEIIKRNREALGKGIPDNVVSAMEGVNKVSVGTIDELFNKQQNVIIADGLVIGFDFEF